MSEPTKANSSTVELLRQSRDLLLKEVERYKEQYDRAKEELKRLDKAIKQWEPKE